MHLPVVSTNEEFSRHFQSEIWLEAAREICRRHKIDFAELKRAASSDHLVFLVDDSFVVKIYRPFRNCFEREKIALEFIGGKTNFKIPEILQSGEIGGYDYSVMTQLSGVVMTRADWLKLSKKQHLNFVSNLANDLKTVHALDAGSFVCDWHDFVKDRAETFIERQIAHGVNRKIIDSLPQFIETNLKLLPKDDPTVFLHGDVHFGNLRLQKTNGNWQISGLFDFADSRRGFHEYDFLAVGLLMIQGQGEIQREFFKSYGYAEADINETLRKRMMMLTMLYETSDLRRYAVRLAPEAVDFSLEELEKAIWNF